MLLALTDCQGSQDITLIMDVYRLALKVNLLLMTVLSQYFHLVRTSRGSTHTAEKRDSRALRTPFSISILQSKIQHLTFALVLDRPVKFCSFYQPCRVRVTPI